VTRPLTPQTAGVTRLVILLVGIAALVLVVARPVTAIAKDGRGEVRVSGSCGRGASSALRLKGRDGDIEVRFEIDHARPSVGWRVALVHERRIAWKGAARTARSTGSLEVRRVLRDLPGADTVTAQAWGPGGLVCRAGATLPDSSD
jgi:hypothetical protein